jgi:hypothetical protein
VPPHAETCCGNTRATVESLALSDKRTIFARSIDYADTNFVDSLRTCPRFHRVWDPPAFNKVVHSKWSPLLHTRTLFARGLIMPAQRERTRFIFDPCFNLGGAAVWLPAGIASTCEKPNHSVTSTNANHL